MEQRLLFSSPKSRHIHFVKWIALQATLDWFSDLQMTFQQSTGFSLVLCHTWQSHLDLSVTLGTSDNITHLCVGNLIRIYISSGYCGFTWPCVQYCLVARARSTLLKLKKDSFGLGTSKNFWSVQMVKIILEYCRISISVRFQRQCRKIATMNN